MLNLYFRSTLFTVFAVLFSLHPVEAAPRKPSVIVKVNDVSHVDRLTKKFDWSATNLVPANEPQDIYQEVADHVSRRVGRDAANSGGNDQGSARQLRGKIQRSVVVPGFGHGTHVAGLLRLIAPEATIWAMRVFEFVLREPGDLQQREEHRFAQSSLYGQLGRGRIHIPGYIN